MVRGAHDMSLNRHVVDHTGRNQYLFTISPIEDDSGETLVGVVQFYAVGMPSCVAGHHKGWVHFVNQQVVVCRVIQIGGGRFGGVNDQICRKIPSHRLEIEGELMLWEVR